MSRHSAWIVALATLSACGAASAAPIPYVGVQFVVPNNGGNTPLASSTVAGVVPQSNFNVANGQSGGPISLVNASGGATGISLSWSADDNWTAGATANGPNGIGDPELLNGEDKTRGTATYTLTGVPAGTYDLFIYTVSDTAANEGSSTITTGSTTGPTTLYNVDQVGTAWNSNPAYLSGGSTTNSTSLTPGNYVEFDNVSPNGTGTLVFQHAFVAIGPGGNSSVAYNGFQLSQVVVPEPAAVTLFAMGALGLLAAAHRRRRA